MHLGSCYLSLWCLLCLCRVWHSLHESGRGRQSPRKKLGQWNCGYCAPQVSRLVYPENKSYQQTKIFFLLLSLKKLCLHTRGSIHKHRCTYVCTHPHTLCTLVYSTTCTTQHPKQQLFLLISYSLLQHHLPLKMLNWCTLARDRMPPWQGLDDV